MLISCKYGHKTKWKNSYEVFQVQLQGVPTVHTYKINVNNDFKLCHKCLGHPNVKIVNVILKNYHKISIAYVSDQFDVCTVCRIGKCHHLPLTNSMNKSYIPLKVVHTDVWGPSPMLSFNGFHWCVLFSNEFTRYAWIYFLKENPF